VVDGMEAIVEKAGMKSAMDTVEINLHNTNSWRRANREDKRAV
jgi:hypothetical protein